MSEVPELELTDAECWFLARKRSGVSQREFAEKLGFTRRIYQKIEYGEFEFHGMGPIPRPSGNSLTEAEFCMIARRRSGWSQFELADRMDISRIWVCKIENGQGNPKRLVDFWAEQLGFRKTEKA